MDETARLGLCPKCGTQQALVARYTWRGPDFDERQLQRLESRCASCGFDREYGVFELPVWRFQS